MSIKEDIFSQFQEKLKADDSIPKKVISQITLLLDNNELTSKEKLLEAIEKGMINDGND